jgi:hypothetical protein
LRVVRRQQLRKLLAEMEPENLFAKRAGDTSRPSQVQRSGFAVESIDRDSMPLLEAYALQ